MRMRACVWFIAGNKNKRTADRMQVSYLPLCTLNRHFWEISAFAGPRGRRRVFTFPSENMQAEAVVLNGCKIQSVYFLIFFGGPQKTASGKKDPYLPITNTLSSAFEFAISAARWLFSGRPDPINITTLARPVKAKCGDF